MTENIVKQLKHAATAPFVAAFFDHVVASEGLKNDRELADKLGIKPPVVSALRAGRIPFGPKYIIRSMEVFGYGLSFVKNFVTGQ